MSHAPSKPMCEITQRQEKDYRITTLDDGIDYWDLASRTLAGDLPCVSLPERGNRQVHFVHHQGQRFVVKTDSRHVSHLDGKLRRLWYGPVYSTAMRRIWKASRHGCDMVQNIYMVAEQMKRGSVRKAILVSEYVEGPTVSEMPDPKSYSNDMAHLVAQLHIYRLAFVDSNPTNFIVTDQGLRIIDMSFADGFLVGRAKDYIYFKDKYGIDLPDAGLLNRLFVIAVRASQVLRSLLRLLLGRHHSHQ